MALFPSTIADTFTGVFMKTTRVLAFYGLLYSTVFLPGGPVFSQGDFYQGKTITIIRGGGPGGSGEFQTRALMKVLEKYIPGQPRLMMEYVQGAAGRKAATLFTIRPGPTG
jgi:tripartite-type tricarboxylate transporter receptor subunit TctC